MNFALFMFISVDFVFAAIHLEKKPSSINNNFEQTKENIKDKKKFLKEQNNFTTGSEYFEIIRNIYSILLDKIRYTLLGEELDVNNNHEILENKNPVKNFDNDTNKLIYEDFYGNNPKSNSMKYYRKVYSWRNANNIFYQPEVKSNQKMKNFALDSFKNGRYKYNSLLNNLSEMNYKTEINDNGLPKKNNLHYGYKFPHTNISSNCVYNQSYEQKNKETKFKNNNEKNDKKENKETIFDSKKEINDVNYFKNHFKKQIDEFKEPFKRLSIQNPINISSLNQYSENHKDNVSDIIIGSIKNGNENSKPKLNKNMRIHTLSSLSFNEPLKFHQYQNDKNFRCDINILESMMINDISKSIASKNTKIKSFILEIITTALKEFEHFLDIQHLNFKKKINQLFLSKIFRNNDFYDEIVMNLEICILNEFKIYNENDENEFIDIVQTVNEISELFTSLKNTLKKYLNGIYQAIIILPKFMFEINIDIYKNLINNISDCSSYEPLINKINFEKLNEIANKIFDIQNNILMEINLAMNDHRNALLKIVKFNLSKKSGRLLDALVYIFENKKEDFMLLLQKEFDFVYKTMQSFLNKSKEQLLKDSKSIFETINQKISTVFEKNREDVDIEIMKLMDKNNEDLLKNALGMIPNNIN